MMDWIECDPLPAVCRRCADRLDCLARGEGEWCCEECENLLERFVPTSRYDRESGDQDEGET